MVMLITGGSRLKNSGYKPPNPRLRQDGSGGKAAEKLIKPYRIRNCTIRKMGLAANYRAYLASPLWAEHRLKVLRRDRFKCQGCADPASEVHHFRYTRKTLAGKATYWMIAICRDCHQFIEFDEQGQKVQLKQTTGRLRILRYKNGLTSTTSNYVRNKIKNRPKHNGQQGTQRPPVRERLVTNETTTSRQ